MTNYWAMAPWPNNEPQIFDQVWSYDCEHGTIAMRWNELGDVTGLTRGQIEDLHRQVYRTDSPPAARMLWDFFNKVELEDVIVARRGRSLCIGIGHVIRTAYHDPERGRRRLNGLSSPYLGSNFIDVEWQQLNTVPVTEMFTIQTLSNIGSAKFHRLFGSGGHQ